MTASIIDLLSGMSPELVKLANAAILVMLANSSNQCNEVDPHPVVPEERRGLTDGEYAAIVLAAAAAAILVSALFVRRHRVNKKAARLALNAVDYERYVSVCPQLLFALNYCLPSTNRDDTTGLQPL